MGQTQRAIDLSIRLFNPLEIERTHSHVSQQKLQLCEFRHRPWYQKLSEYTILSIYYE